MAGKTWEPSKKGARELERHIRKGTVVYTLSDISSRLAPYEDPHLYNAHEFTRRSPVTGKWMTGHITAQTLLAQEGTVYEKPPAGIRGMHQPAPQVAGPLGSDDYEGLIDEDEFRFIAKHQRDSLPPHLRRALNARRP